MLLPSNNKIVEDDRCQAFIPTLDPNSIRLKNSNHKKSESNIILESCNSSTNQANILQKNDNRKVSDYIRNIDGKEH